MKLVIVESPAKAKTISKFLGDEYVVEASYGHIRDLPGSADEIPAEHKGKPWARMAVDVDNDFTPIYVVTKDSKKQIAVLRKLMKDADEVVLATDEDREGEAISWHLVEALKPKVPVSRIVFHEITKDAIDEAIANPRAVDNGLVRAQESRRILDRLYGYSLSPVLWKKVRTKLSAGRVQSVAVRLVVEREEERRAFHRATYWDIDAQVEGDAKAFTASLQEWKGKRLASGKDFDADTGKLKNDKVYLLEEAEAKTLVEQLKTNLPWKISGVDQKAAKLRPQPPYITSSLQQAASSLMGFSPKQTMQVAQRLYEGVDLGGGDREGLITYMRTDSVVLSNKALGEAQHYIESNFGDGYHHRRQFTTKAKMAQEAHEAIRPTSFKRHPDTVARLVSADELKLYRLIWNRALASQMEDAQLEKTTVNFTVNIDSDVARLRSNGSIVTFPGFLRVANSSQQDTELPALKEGDEVGPGKALTLNGMEASSHETKPPARFNEASLVKRLEEEGIGRPSTYAPTVTLIQARGYVEKQGKALVPTYVGIAVTILLRRYFTDYVSMDFTARMENVLDNIAEGEQDWKQFLNSFYNGAGDFGEGLQKSIERQMEEIEYPNIPVGMGENDQPIIVRLGRNAPFLQRGEGGDGNTASVPMDVPYDELTVEKAEELIALRAKGNEPIGVHPESGENVYALLGPYGPYIQLGEQGEDKKKKPKRVSLLRGFPLENVTFEIALEYLTLPKNLGDHPEKGKSIRVAIGRFGPYVVHDGDFRSIPKDESIFTITFERALELLNQPKGYGRGKKLLKEMGTLPDGETKLTIFEGRYGAYVTDGSVNASLPKDKKADDLTIPEAMDLLRVAAEKKPRKKKKAAAKRKKKATTKKKAATKKKATAKKKSAAKKKP